MSVLKLFKSGVQTGRVFITSLTLLGVLTGFAAHAQAQGCSAADQIPNPNPVGSTITNTSPTGCNGLTPFDNIGTLNNSGTFDNIGTLNNGTDYLTPGTLNNTGTLHNIGRLNDNGRLNNIGTLINAGIMWVEGAFYNSGTFNNDGAFTKLIATNPQPGAFVNTGTINNSGSFGLFGSLRNEGTLNNYGNFGAGDGSLLNTGMLNNYGSLLNACCAGIGNTGTLNNYGNIETREWGFGNSGVLNNVGVLNIRTVEGSCAGPDRLCGSLSNSGTLHNSGTMNNGGKLFNDGQFNNSGQFISAKFVLGTGIYTQTAGTTRIDGSMTQSAVNINGGVLQGVGNITGLVTVNGGTISPGNSAGTLTIDGGLSFNSGTLLTEIGGTGAGQFDLLKVTGTASFLSGTLAFDFFNDFIPHVGDKWTFLTADGGVSGWEGMNLAVSGWDVDYRFFLTSAGNDGLTLHVAAAPEPEIYAMMVVGLGLLGWVGRRKRLMERTAA